MSTSRSHAPTIWQPAIRRIWTAWASAVFPQPTMAILSNARLLPAGVEVPLQAFGGRHLLTPAHDALQLLVRVAAALPVRVPRPAIEGRRQLPSGELGIPLPERAQEVAHAPRDQDGAEARDVLLVEPQELTARRQFVVHDVQDVAVDAGGHAGEHDGIGAVVDIGER